MNIDLTKTENRKSVLEGIKSLENVKRKKESLIDYEIYNDRIHKYVYDEIKNQTSEKTAKAMPIVSCINIGKRIVDNEATIYNSDPVRTTNLSESDNLAVLANYEDAGFNSKLQKANKYFKYRKQGFVQVVPKDKMIQLRPLLSHHVDVVPDSQDPEKAYAYIISAFDKNMYIAQGDNSNQVTADQDDYKSSLERYVVWTAEYNFIMNGRGELIGEPQENPIKILPFVDISKDKDFEFFVRSGMSLSEFTVLYNTIWSDDLYITRMQGFSVGVFRGNPELMPREYYMGPNRAIVLPVDPKNENNSLDFKFVSPTPDLNGSRESRAALLANFLTSRGISPKVISSALQSGENYASGFERLLAMIDKFEATKEDFDLFRSVEKSIYKIVISFLVHYSRTDFLDKKYNVGNGAANSEMTIKFHEPQMVQTEKDKLENYKLKIELGISDKVLALMDLEGLDEIKAQEKIDSILERKSVESESISLLPNEKSGAVKDEAQTI